MTQISLPRGSSETCTNEWNDVYSNDNAITTVVNGQLSNDNIDPAAAIAHSKLANATSGQLLIANSSGVITATTASGDVTVSNTGAVTIANSAVTSAKIADGTIATGDIADSAVTSAKIADSTIATGDVANGAITADKLPTADASSLGLNTTAVTNRRNKATNATERTTINTSTLGYKIPSLSFTIAVPTYGFILYGIQADLKSSNAAGTTTLFMSQDGLTPAAPLAQVSNSGTTYQNKSEGNIAAAPEFVTPSATVTCEAYLYTNNASYTASAKNITIWAVALEVA